ncbi:hypothetical protein ACFMQL_40470 [Nonomuraea fastidiosa]|jgi:hypothetical protein
MHDDDMSGRPPLGRRVLVVAGAVLLTLAYVLMGAASFALITRELG